MRATALVALLAACGPPPGDDLPDKALPGTSVRFDPTAAAEGGYAFYAAPYPLSTRFVDGVPPLADLPGVPDEGLVADVAATMVDRRGASAVSVGWFGFDAPLATRREGRVMPPDAMSPVQLVELGPDGPRRLPTVARTLEVDPWVAENVLAVAAMPGVVMRPVPHAFLVRRDLGDADGAELGVPLSVRVLLAGGVPDAPWGDDVAEAFAPLVAALPDLGLTPDDLAAATVFEVEDVVAEVEALSDRVRERHRATIMDLSAGDDGFDWPGYCALKGELLVPQFQQGTPPFATGGLFAFDDDGLPIVQRQERIPIVVTIPKMPMPPEGFPLTMYFHGSGGRSDQLVTRGPSPGRGQPAAVGEGPAYVLAQRGIAAAGSAHPVNPERVPNASAIAYLNFNNLAAFRDTFRQGILEQRLYLDALLDLEIPAARLAGCFGLKLPDTTTVRFDPASVLASGQSMGGMYTNLVSAVDPRISAVVPTGAGGHWSRFILETSLFSTGTAETLLAGVLGTDVELSWLHPGLHLAQVAWEPAEPMVYMPRLSVRPLPGHPVRPVYQPVGLGDSYFPPSTFDAMAVAYGTQQAGDEVWPDMQVALKRVGRGGVDPYPVADNARSEDGTPYTGVVVQYAGDGFSDPHVIFTQLDEVKHQYGCFLRTWLDEGVAVVPEGGALGDPCPGP